MLTAWKPLNRRPLSSRICAGMIDENGSEFRSGHRSDQTPIRKGRSLECVMCGRIFEPAARSAAITCSPECATARRKQTEREYERTKRRRPENYLRLKRERWIAFHLASSPSLALLAFSPGERGLRPRALRPDASTRTSSLFPFWELAGAGPSPSADGSLFGISELAAACASSEILATVLSLSPTSLATESA